MSITSNIFPDNDGVVYTFATDTWANNRKAASGTLNTSSSYYIQNSHTSGRGGDTYQIGRYFLEFDTSGINNTLSSASLNLYGNSLGTLDVILLKSNQTGAITTADYNNIDGAAFPLAVSNGTGGGTLDITVVTQYSIEIDTWDTSGYNKIELTPRAKADIIANDTFNCVLMGHDYDFRDIAPSEEWYRVGFYQDAYGTTSRDPVLTLIEQDNSVFNGCNF